MAYEKQTWQTGDVITQEKLNHMEDGIADMGGSDAGYECTETREELFNETVTTVAQGGNNLAALTYSTQITVDTLVVTFDGVEYTCSRISPVEGMNGYGGVGAIGTDFSKFPFAIMSAPNNSTVNTLYTKTAGEHTVKAETTEIQIESITPCFKRAVENLISEERHIYFEISGSDFSGYNTSISRQELFELVDEGKANRLVARPQSDALLECRFGGGMTQDDGICFIGLFSASSDNTKDGVALLVYTIPRSGEIKRKQVQLTTWAVNA